MIRSGRLFLVFQRTQLDKIWSVEDRVYFPMVWTWNSWRSVWRRTYWNNPSRGCKRRRIIEVTVVEVMVTKSWRGSRSIRRRKIWKALATQTRIAWAWAVFKKCWIRRGCLGLIVKETTPRTDWCKFWCCLFASVLFSRSFWRWRGWQFPTSNIGPFWPNRTFLCYKTLTYRLLNILFH